VAELLSTLEEAKTLATTLLLTKPEKDFADVLSRIIHDVNGALALLRLEDYISKQDKDNGP